MEGLPSLWENTRNVPKSLQVRKSSITRQTTKLPDIGLRHGRQSVVSTYSHKLYRPKKVTFLKNGDKFFEGLKVNVSSKYLRNLEILKCELSRSIDLPAGVRNIYTPEAGHKITDIDQLEDQKSYVCASSEPLKKINYGKAKTPTWDAGTKLKFPPVQLNMHGSIPKEGKGPSSEEKSHILGRRNKTRRRALPPFSTQYQSETSIPNGKQPLVRCLPTKQPSTSQPTLFAIICNGQPPRKIVNVSLDKSTFTSWEQVYSLIEENLQSMEGNEHLRLYSADGVEVKSLSQIWNANGVLIAVKQESFNIAQFWSVSKPTRGKKKMMLTLNFNIKNNFKICL